MQQLMAEQGGQMGRGMPGGMNPEAQQAQEEQRQAAEEQRQSMLVAVMTSDARARLARIALVKPEKARAVESMILAAAQRGQLGEKISDERLIGMLESINDREGGGSKGPKITIQRRRPAFDDEDDW